MRRADVGGRSSRNIAAAHGRGAVNLNAQWGVSLNGRAGLSALGEVVNDLCIRAGVDDADVSGLVGALSGYVVDSPSDSRAALEPLMAAYDFAAAERDGRVAFFHTDLSAPAQLSLDELAASSTGDAFAQRSDGADTAAEARVRFIDPERDFRLASVSARRLDRAEGGVVTIEAPLVLEPQTAEAIAQRVLAQHRAMAETMRLDLGPAQLALEPGDTVRLDAGAIFEVVRIEDAGVRRAELQRAHAPASPQVDLGDAGAPSTPFIASTPALSILDLPRLPGAEEETRPLAAVFASPWLGPHHVYGGSALTRRAIVSQPATMGELLWALWPGPVDRWDDGNVIRIRLYAGALASATPDAVLDGANAFAIEAEGGEWEIVQARECTLVAPNEYQLSGFLRGQLGSAHAMRAPHLVGARIVKLDSKLARVDMAAHEWGEALTFAAPPAGAPATDARATRLTLALPHAATRPWAPAHLRARRGADGDVAVSWIRCANQGGDAWGAGEPPLGAPAEQYLLEIMDGETVRRSVTVSSPSYLYGTADQMTDFGSPPASLRLRVAQIGENGAAGLNKELTITL